MPLNQIFKIEFVNADLSAEIKTKLLAELVNTIIQGGLKLDYASDY